MKSPILFIDLLIFIVDAFKENKQKRIRYICDSCGIVLKGKFIRVTEQDLKQPLDYCTAACKKRHISMDRIKFSK